ncbi:MAG: outer membrane lipoprotein-sorting protein [Candidatus Methylomirabilia bacterium]
MMRSVSLILAAVLLHPVVAAADTPEEKGLRIAIKAHKYDEGFGDYMVDGKMILRNNHGQESVRTFSHRRLETAHDGEKSLNVFRSPRAIKGTALLTYSHRTGRDDQWLYLPALKRVKRISSANKSGAFVGSEFAYEDLSSREVEKYTYRWLRNQPCPGAKHLSCFVTENYPTEKRSGYRRQVIWIEQRTYRIFRIDYYDRKDALLKTLTVHRYRRYLGKHWRASRFVMRNNQTGKSTELIWDNYKFRNGFSDRDFNKNSLKRARR